MRDEVLKMFEPVSYTHLDVYKRQSQFLIRHPTSLQSALTAESRKSSGHFPARHSHNVAKRPDSR